MSLATRLVGILGAVCLAVLLASILQSVRVDDVYRRSDRASAEVHRATRLALVAQVHFKRQVQEWKNILLRGGQAADRAKYYRQFQAETRWVRTVTTELIAILPEQSLPRQHAEDFAKAHYRLEEQYERGYRLFVEDPSDPFRVDVRVRGIDREPTKLLDRVVEGVDEWRSRHLKSSADQLGSERRNALAVQVLVILSAIVLMLWALRQWIYRPIVTLTDAAERLAKGELGLRVPIKPGGELGVLAATFNQMSTQLAGLVDEMRSKAALEQELEVAESVQTALIPSANVHRLQGLEIAGRYLPASRCGGDWWSFFAVSPSETLILVGDVTGHGVPTTLITASVNACCQELYRTSTEMNGLDCARQQELRAYVQQRGTLSYLLTHLNRCIARVGQGRFLMTFSAALIDANRNTLTVASAGHEPPLLVPTQSDSAIEPLYTGPSMRLGESFDPKVIETHHRFEPGDTIVCYTDGLVDVVGQRRRAYGDGRLLRVLRKNRTDSVDVMTKKVLSDVRSFSEGSVVVDDMTLVVVRRSSEILPEASTQKTLGLQA